MSAFGALQARESGGQVAAAMELPDDVDRVVVEGGREWGGGAVRIR